MRQSKTLIAALAWLAKGAAVVPAQPRSKEVLLRWREYERQPPTVNQAVRWFDNGVMNLALVCGTGGLIVLDFDDPEQYMAWTATAGAMAKTYAETTGRGLHLFYQVDQPRTFRFEYGEVLGPGHLCILAPSIHPSGSQYQPVGPYPVMRIETAKLYSLLSEKPKPAMELVDSPRAGSGSGPVLFAAPIAKIKAAVTIQYLLVDKTVLRPSGGGGRWQVGRCPFHEDRRPSLWVDTDRQLFGCYSPDCIAHRGGDVVNLYSLLHGLGPGEAVRAMAAEFLP